jgi:hypothetical protein
MKIDLYESANEALTLEAFADKHGLVMEIRARSLGSGQCREDASRYFAKFRSCEIKDGACLIGAYGDGATPNDAMGDYARQISGRLLIVDAMLLQRREIRVPNLAHYAIDIDTHPEVRRIGR